MVLDSNPSPYNNFDHINSDSISKMPDPDTSSHHQNFNFHSLLENPELPFQGKGKEVAMASSSSSSPIFHQFLQLKSECSGKIEPEEGEKKIMIESLNISFPLNANPVRKIPCPQLYTIAEMTTLSANAISSEDFSISQFSHNPSCSLTRSWTENNSIDQQVWNAEEETVYGKFRPHGFTFTNYINEVKETNSNKIDAELIYPLELPAIATEAVDTALSLENETADDVSFGLRSERLLKDIVCDCECEVCIRGIGFCRECMCMVCTQFGCATNTCTWVGCGMCSHWCHALCAFEKNLFKPGLTQKSGNGPTEIQFMCPQCAYGSQIFGFVKNVFTTRGKTWGVETLMKELDCVRMIFHLSEDPEGKELEKVALQMLIKLDKKKISAVDACEAIVKFFNDGVSDHSVMGASSSNPIPTISLPETQLKPTPILSLNQAEIKTLETNIRLKEAEANLFQRLADEARKELENYLMIQQATTKGKNMYLQHVDAKKRKDSEEPYQTMEGKCRHVAKMRKRVEVTEEEI